jgi:hypothetical protein
MLANEIELYPDNINREGSFVSVNLEASYQLPKIFQDMTQVHLVMQPSILNLCFVNNPTPSTEVMECHFVAGPFNNPHHYILPPLLSAS